jgi:hypothetical protein
VFEQEGAEEDIWKEDEVTGKTCIMRSFMACTGQQILG